MFSVMVSLCVHKMLPPQSPLSFGYILLTNWIQDLVLHPKLCVA